MASTDQLVLAKILEGDEEALNRAYLDCRQKCIAYLRLQFTYSAEAAAELYNDAFVEMWRNTLAGKLETITNSLVAYISGVMQNKAQEQLRTHERQSRLLEKMASQMPTSTEQETELEEEQERQRVQLLLDRLGDRCRRLLVMHYFLHFDDHVVAEDMGMPYDRIRKERHKCLSKARGEIQKVENL
jgi:RNA polymerase sigma factor (sigma-70 family)